jgi:methionyl-tRNA formyltransferase
VKIIFFGTPEIAVPFLKELRVKEDIAGVVAQPDKPAERGQKLRSPAVKTFAAENGIPVFQPQNPDGALAGQLKELKPDVGVVVSYGRLIPEAVFTAPALGCFNVHFSLLPKYRGAAPMQRALMNGEAETGVTTFWIEKTLDSGPVLVQKKLRISADDDAVTLALKLTACGIEAMNETLDRIRKGECAGVPQQGEPSFAPPLKKEDGRINWALPAKAVHNLVRGTRVWPGAYTVIPGGKLEGKRLKILKTRAVEDQTGAAEPGRVTGTEKDRGFIVKCGEGSLAVEEVHLENKNPVPAWSFWQGRSLSIGDKL